MIRPLLLSALKQIYVTVAPVVLLIAITQWPQYATVIAALGSAFGIHAYNMTAPKNAQVVADAKSGALVPAEPATHPEPPRA